MQGGEWNSYWLHFQCSLIGQYVLAHKQGEKETINSLSFLSLFASVIKRFLGLISSFCEATWAFKAPYIVCLTTGMNWLSGNFPCPGKRMLSLWLFPRCLESDGSCKVSRKSIPLFPALNIVSLAPKEKYFCGARARFSLDSRSVPRGKHSLGDQVTKSFATLLPSQLVFEALSSQKYNFT